MTRFTRQWSVLEVAVFHATETSAAVYVDVRIVYRFKNFENQRLQIKDYKFSSFDFNGSSEMLLGWKPSHVVFRSLS